MVAFPFPFCFAVNLGIVRTASAAEIGSEPARARRSQLTHAVSGSRYVSNLESYRLLCSLLTTAGTALQAIVTIDGPVQPSSCDFLLEQADDLHKQGLSTSNPVRKLWIGQNDSQ